VPSSAPPAPLSVDLRRPHDHSEEVLAALLTVPGAADELGARFAAAGHALHLVGGSVRDLLLGRTAEAGGVPDLDFATDAPPERVLEIARGWAEGTWELGIAFGTVGLTRGGTRLEVTTYRTESYEERSRNPQVRFGTSLEEDLGRRDFTINAMAVSVPGHVFADPYGGLRDLAAGVLRTPGSPAASFTDDPLRMLRAVRFRAQLGFTIAPEVVDAMRELAPRLRIVSPERVRDELTKTLLAPDPVPALELFTDTGLADVVLPELPRLRMPQESGRAHKDVCQHSLAVLRRAIDREDRLPGGGPDLVVRLAALLHDVGKPDTRRYEPGGGGVSFHHHEVVGARLARDRLAALRFPGALVADVARLVRLHLRFHGYGSGPQDTPWTDSAVRRYVTDAGPLLDRLHVLVRSDCTTRNARKAAALDAAYDALEARIAALREREELAEAAKPDLDGVVVQRLLGIGPGPLVGAALRHLTERKLSEGPLGADRAAAELRAWGREQGLELPELPET